MNNKNVQERLLSKENLYLDKEIQIFRATEEVIVKEQNQEISHRASSSEVSAQVDKISTKHQQTKSNQTRPLFRVIQILSFKAS